jgi:hypothetical protein
MMAGFGLEDLRPLVYPCPLNSDLNFIQGLPVMRTLFSILNALIQQTLIGQTLFSRPSVPVLPHFDRSLF